MRRLVSVLALFLAMASSAAAETVDVAVACDPAARGASLRAVRVADRGAAAVLAATVAVPADGNCRLALEPGRYVFEALATAPKELIALRTEPREIARPATVTLAGRRTKVSAALDDRPLPIRALRVPSSGDDGDLVWRPEGGAAVDAVMMLVSPGVALDVAVHAGDERSQLVLWAPLDARADATVLRGRTASAGIVGALAGESSGVRVHALSFPRAAGGPAYSSIVAHVGLAAWVVDVRVGDGSILATNRRYVRIAYDAELADGRLVRFYPRGRLIDADAAIELGGAIEARAWAGFVRNTDGARRPHLRWGVSLVDAAGNEVDRPRSRLEDAVAATLSDGAPLPSSPLSDDGRARIGDLATGISVSARWRDDEPRARTLRPEPFALFKSEHFELMAPRCWSTRAENYLAIAERTHAALRRLSRRPGPRRVRVGWRPETHNAKAQVGGDDAWMSLPFEGLREAHGFFEPPRHAVHEIAHTFGYQHGGRMDDVVARAIRELRAFRSRLEDDSAYVPAARVTPW